MKVHLRTLGQLDLRGPDGAELRSVLVQPKRVALLTYLAVARPQGFHRRDSLLALLWPDQDAEHARGALRQALYGLRRSLGARVLTRGEDVSVAPDGLTCDVWSFEKAVRDGAAAEAVELYGGEFLTGFFLAGAPEFEHWVEAERSRLSRAFAETLERLAEETSGLDPARALGYWRRLAEHDPYTPRSALRLMQALEAAGDAPSAIRHAEEHATLLREELDAEADAEVSAFAERLRKRPVSVPPRAFPAVQVVGPADTPTPLPAAQPPATGSPAAPPAARREREHRVRDFLTGGGLGVLVGVPVALVVAGALHALVPGAVPLALPGSMVAVALAVMLAETAGATWLLRRERGTAPRATPALRSIPTRLFGRSSGRMGAGAGLMLGVLVSLSASYSLAPRPEPVPPRASARLRPSAPDDTVRRRVAITRFANLTGDPTYDPIGRMAEDWVSRRLRSIPEAEVVGSGAGTLADTSAESVDALARQVGADVIVFGRYYREGTDVLLDARLVPLREGRVPREIAALAIGPVRAPRDRPVAGTERLAAIVAGALAWCRGAECTVPGRRPPTYAAYRLFRDGMQARRTGEIEKAKQSYRSAIALDSTYGQAYRALAVQSECPQKDSIGEILEVRRQDFAEFDLLYMRAERAHCHGDVEAVYRYSRRIYELAPAVPGSGAGVAVGAVHSGRLAEAERRLKSLGTDLRPVDYATLASALHLQGKIEEELQAAAEGRRRFPAEEISAYFGWPGVAARGRPQDLEARIEETRRAGASLPGTAALYLDMAQELDWHGHAEAARQFAARALQEFDRIPQAQRVMFWPVRVRALMQLGRWDAAHQLVDSVPARGRWGITLRGVTAATAGDRTAARAALSALAQLPDSAFGDYPAREVCEAAVLAARGDKAEALRRLANGQARGTLPRSDPQYAHARYLLRPLWHDPRLDRMFAARD